MKSDPIQKYILRSERNLGIAAAVSAAWPEVREKLGSAFLARLDTRLKRKLKGWESGRWARCFTDECPNFSLWKPAWKAQYSVTLQFDNYGERMSFGLSRDEDQKHISKQPRSAEVLTAVRERHPSAFDRTWWEAKVFMQSPATDWGKPEVLWQMHTDPKFLEDVAAQLLGVAEISEPIVNRFVDRLARKK